MKQLLYLFFFVPFYALAQDCTLKTSVDDFTNEKKMTTGFTSFGEGKNKFQLSVDATNKEIDFFFSISGGAEGWCFDNNSTVIIQYAGTRSKTTHRNTGSMNCQGLFHFTYRNVASTPGALNRLATQPIEALTFKHGDKQYEFFIDESQREKLSRVITCIVNESKSLL